MSIKSILVKCNSGAAKGVIAVVIFAAIFFSVGKEELVTTLRAIDLLSVIILFVVGFLLILVSAIKWQLFLRASGAEVSILRLFTLYIVGYFFNLVGPSFLGGDIVRSYHVGAQTGRARDAFVSTFLERFTGLVAMAALALGAVLWGAETTKGFEVAIICVALGTGFLSGLCFSRRLSQLAIEFVPRLLRLCRMRKLSGKVGDILIKMDRAFEFGRGNLMLIIWALVWSFVYHSLTVVNTLVAAHAVGWKTFDIAGLFVAVPLVLIISMVPITPNGLGLQEGAFYLLLQRLGATEGQAIGVGLLLRVKVVIIGLFGGLLWLSMKKHKGEVGR